MKKVFFLDIDGTILNTEPTVSEYNINAMKTARKNGDKIFINTGRGKACIPEAILALPLDGIVSGCGCTVTIDGEDVYSAKVSTDILENYVRGIFARKEKCFLEGEKLLFRINAEPEDIDRDPVFAKYCSDARLDFSIWQPLTSPDQLFGYYGAHIPKINLVGKYNQNELARYAMSYDGVIHSTQCEMWVKGNSKATGMKYVMDNYFPGYTCVSIGDSMNDAEMLMAADISVAMGNARDQVKKMCTMITDTCENDGVGKAILNISDK